MVEGPGVAPIPAPSGPTVEVPPAPRVDEVTETAGAEVERLAT
jgi:hypothetical protein